MKKPTAEKTESTYWQEAAKLFSKTAAFGLVGFVRQHTIPSDTAIDSSGNDEAINNNEFSSHTAGIL